MQPIVIPAGELLLTFVWRGDRYAHRVSLAVNAMDRPGLESVETEDESAWPASPPLQQLHIERRPGGITVALAVGMAGRSHWSAAFEVDPRVSRIACDVACRLQASPAWLGSTYRLAPHTNALCVVAANDTTLHTLSNDLSLCQVTPAMDVVARPTTVQWAYHIVRCA